MADSTVNMSLESTAADTAVRAVLATQRSRFLAFVRQRAGSVVDPEEIWQIAAERALARSGQIRDLTRVEAWIGRIVRNVLTDELRRRQVMPIDIDDLDLPAPTADAEPCRCALALVRTLKPAYADLLTRVFMSDTPITVAAQEMGITANNAMVRLHRARQALSAQLREHCGTTSTHTCQTCRCTTERCCEGSGP